MNAASDSRVWLAVHRVPQFERLKALSTDAVNSVASLVAFAKKGCKETRKRGRVPHDSDDDADERQGSRDRRAVGGGSATHHDTGVGAEAWHASAGRRADGSGGGVAAPGRQAQKRARYGRRCAHTASSLRVHRLILARH